MLYLIAGTFGLIIFIMNWFDFSPTVSVIMLGILFCINYFLQRKYPLSVETRNTNVNTIQSIQVEKQNVSNVNETLLTDLKSIHAEDLKTVIQSYAKTIIKSGVIWLELIAGIYTGVIFFNIWSIKLFQLTLTNIYALIILVLG